MHNIFQEGSFFTLLIGSKGIKINNWNMDDNPVQIGIVFLNALTRSQLYVEFYTKKAGMRKLFL